MVLLGLTSLFTDVSSEMVSAILPLYATFGLGLTPFQFGLVDGLYQGLTAPLRLLGGVLADRWRRFKEIAVLGYGISAACKLGLAAIGNAWLPLTGILFLDRTGKGIRTAPRDALVSLSSPPDRLGRAFGVHRSLDTAGAMLGPLVAFLLLALLPGAYDVLFMVSFCAALIGLAILGLFVENRHRTNRAEDEPPVSLRKTISLLRAPGFRAVMLSGAVLALATVSDGFVYLTLQRRLDLSLGIFPLLYVATSAVYLVLAAPVGRVADRLGRAKVFLAGQVLLLAVYAVLLRPDLGTVETLGALALFGAYYAATDGVLMALASAVLPAGLRASGLALLTTATSLCRLGASLLFGLLWMRHGSAATVWVFLGSLAAAIALSAALLSQRRVRT